MWESYAAQRLFVVQQKSTHLTLTKCSEVTRNCHKTCLKYRHAISLYSLMWSLLGSTLPGGFSCKAWITEGGLVSESISVYWLLGSQWGSLITLLIATRVPPFIEQTGYCQGNISSHRWIKTDMTYPHRSPGNSFSVSAVSTQNQFSIAPSKPLMEPP